MHRIQKASAGKLDRRELLKRLGTGALAVGVISLPAPPMKAQGGSEFGFGTYILPGATGFQHAEDSSKQVFLVTPFAFDVATKYVSCIALSNSEPFIFPSAGLGDVTIPANGFFMEMVGSPDILEPNGKPTGIQGARVAGNEITLTGRVRSITRLLNAVEGSPVFTSVEFVDFTVIAADNGTPGAGQDTFEMTVGFQLALGEQFALEIGGQADIFGKSATFSGTITTGEIHLQPEI